jgi:hypothetical protein
MLLVTPAYMAPELWRGARPSPASDQYALAVTLLECLLGTTPHGSHSLRKVLESVRGGAWPRIPARLRGRHPALEAVLDRALAADPGARFPDLDAFGEALGEAPAEATRPPAPTRRVLPASSPGTPSRLPAASPGSFWGLPALGAALLLAAGGCLLPGSGPAPVPAAPVLAAAAPGSNQLAALRRAHRELMAAHAALPDRPGSPGLVRTAWLHEHQQDQRDRVRREDYQRLWKETAWSLQDWMVALRTESEEAAQAAVPSPFEHPEVGEALETIAFRDLVHVFQDVLRLRVSADLAGLAVRDPRIPTDFLFDRASLEQVRVSLMMGGGMPLMQDLQTWPEPVPAPVLVLRLRLEAFFDQAAAARDCALAMRLLEDPGSSPRWHPWLARSLLDNLATVASEAWLSLEERLQFLERLGGRVGALGSEVAWLIVGESLRLACLTAREDLLARIRRPFDAALAGLEETQPGDPALRQEAVATALATRIQLAAQYPFSAGQEAAVAALEASLHSQGGGSGSGGSWQPS